MTNLSPIRWTAGHRAAALGAWALATGCVASVAAAPAPPDEAAIERATFVDEFDRIDAGTWQCEYTCPKAKAGAAKFRLKAGVPPDHYGSWSKLVYKPQRFTSGRFKVRFALSKRPKQAVWWGVALWDDGPSANKFNEINFGYTTSQSFTNTQFFFESARLGKAKSIKIDVGVDLYDGKVHEGILEYDQNHVSLYFDGKLMSTITDRDYIPTDPMDFIIGPRLVTGSDELAKDFIQTVDRAEITAP